MTQAPPPVDGIGLLGGLPTPLAPGGAATEAVLQVPDEGGRPIQTRPILVHMGYPYLPYRGNNQENLWQRANDSIALVYSR